MQNETAVPLAGGLPDHARITTQLQGEAAEKRELKWAERSIEQKIEALRECLTLLAGTSDRAGREASEALALVEIHEHHPIRGIMKPHFAHKAGWDGFALRRVRVLLG